MSEKNFLFSTKTFVVVKLIVVRASVTVGTPVAVVTVYEDLSILEVGWTSLESAGSTFFVEVNRTDNSLASRAENRADNGWFDLKIVKL